MSDNGVTKQLQKYYRIQIKNDNQFKTVFPSTIDSLGNSRPVKLSTDIQKYFEEWKSDLVSQEDIKNRMQRYSDLDFMVANCGFIQTAVKLYANETITPDENGKIINVYARDKKVEAYINEFFQKIGINRSILEDTAFNIAKYADSFWIRSISPEEGIYEITPIDVRELKDRIEFSAIDELNKKIKRNWTMFSHTNIQIKDLVDAISEKIKDSDYGAMYKRYLFGFILGDLENIILPPWSISHFRRFSTQSEFSPFGRPLLINSLSLFREYRSALNLISMARVAKFPKEVYEVNMGAGMTPTEKIIALNEVRQEYQNLVDFNNGREDFAIGSSIWTVKDVIEYHLQENNMNLDDIADAELLRDELITSTLVPKGYLITGESNWGDSGKALLQQSKIFAREVFTNQTAILNELTDLVKTQFVIKGLFDKEDTEFELSLPFPNSEQSSQNIQNQKDTMDLANAVIENLKTALAIDSIPPEVAKDIFKTYSSLDPKDLDKWFKNIQSAIDLEIKQPEYKEPKYESKIKESLKQRLNEDVFRDAYFNAKKQKSFTEGVFNNQHFIFNCRNNINDKLKFSLIKEMLNEKKKIEG
jgi:hypothetical protein